MGFAFVLTFAILHLARSADLWPSQDECGKLNMESFYKPTNVTELNEYPWVGRVAYEDRAGEYSYRCLAVLISRRYLLTPAHCHANSDMTVDHVLLGDWNLENSPDERDCDDLGKCAPPPKKYQVEEIVIHPEYNRYVNDLTLLRLSTDVTFTEYISPVCMPPRQSDANVYAGQFLPYAGFLLIINNEKQRRTKLLLHVSSQKSCSNSVQTLRFKLTDKHICGISNGALSMMSGAPVMAVSLVDDEPHSFYVLGLVTAGTPFPVPSVPDVFVRISSYRDWIEFNVVQ